jgi:hypothetical protein
MLNTVAVEVIQHGVPANLDRIARPVRGGCHRCADALEVDGHGTSLPRAGANATDLSRPRPRRDSERWS